MTEQAPPEPPAAGDSTDADGAARIRVFVAGNVCVTREALVRFLVEDAPGIEVVGDAAFGPELEALLRSSLADVALLDIGAGGTTTVVRKLARTSHARLIAVGLPEQGPEVIACAEAGASGYVGSDASLDDLLRSIESVVRGEPICSPRIVGKLLNRLALLASQRSPLPLEFSLTARELQVAELMSEGLTNKEIARRLSIQVATVKNHVHHVLEKLRVERRSDLRARFTLASLRDGS